MRVKTDKILVDKAIRLYQARLKSRKKTLNKGLVLDKQKLGYMLYPCSRDETIRVSMHDMSTGRRKSVNVDHIGRIAFELGVDANFLFGFPSRHDKDYQKLVDKKG